MENLIRHAQGNLVQLCQLLGKSVPAQPNSTLNQKFGIGTDVALAANDIHKAQYWSIGNGGLYQSSAGGDGILDISAWPHITSHSALYNHVPFVIRAVGSDLSAGDRNKYRMRVPIAVGGNNYIAYYLKVIDLSTVNPVLEMRTESGGVITSAAFNHTSSDLDPATPAGGSTIVPNGNYVAATARLKFSMNATETTDFMDAINILFNGSLGKGNITEIGLCTGVDKSVTGGDAVTYNEAIQARVACSFSTIYPMHKLPSGVETYINLESVDAMLAFA